MTLDEYILEVKTGFFAREPKCRDLSNDNFKKGIKKALPKFSRFRPRKNSPGVAEGSSSSKYVPLESDFMLIDYDQLYFIATGVDIGPIGMSSGTNDYYSPLSIFDRDLSATLFPPRLSRTSYGFNVGNNSVYRSGIGSGGVIVRLWSDSNGLWNLILPDAPKANFSREYYYSALHQITDDEFTIPEADLDVFEALVFAFACEALALDEASKDNPTKPASVIGYYMEMADKYNKRIGEFQKYGGYV